MFFENNHTLLLNILTIDAFLIHISSERARDHLPKVAFEKAHTILTNKGTKPKEVIYKTYDLCATYIC